MPQSASTARRPQPIQAESSSAAAAAAAAASGGGGCCPMFHNPYHLVNAFTSSNQPMITPVAQQCLLGAQAAAAAAAAAAVAATQLPPPPAPAPVNAAPQPSNTIISRHQHNNYTQMPSSIGASAATANNGANILGLLNSSVPLRQQHMHQPPTSSSQLQAQNQQQQQPPQSRSHHQQGPQPAGATTAHATSHRNNQPVIMQEQQQNNNYTNTSIFNQNLSLPLHHLLARHHLPASNCVALAAAAALASASLPHLQQLQHQQQHHQQQHQSNQAPINPHSQHATTANNSTATTIHPVPAAINNSTSSSNQVPMPQQPQQFNSYISAQPSNNHITTTPSSALQSSVSNQPNSVQPQQQSLHHNQQHQTSMSHVDNGLATDNTISNDSSSCTGADRVNNSSVDQQQRPLAADTSLNSVANQQQQQPAFRGAQANPHNRPSQQATATTPVPVHQQQPNVANQNSGQQVNRNLFGDDSLNSLFNEHFHAILLNQLLANHQFTSAPTQQQPPSQAPQVPALSSGISTTRADNLSSNSIIPSQSILNQAAPTTQVQQPVDERQNVSTESQPMANSRLASIPIHQRNQNEPLHSSSNLQNQANPNAPISAYQTSPQNMVSGLSRTSETTQPQPQNQNQQPAMPHMPFYPLSQMEQALAIIANPHMAGNIFSQVVNLYLQSGFRPDTHNQHQNHNSQHHFHIHGSQHHHLGQNGQNNGHDVTMPLDSLAISESKPRGLSRAEIDSLAPYIQMNEKDSRTCVICLSRFELKSKIRPLSCNHVFHAKCVDKWLRANRTCPICRRDALKTFTGKIKRV